MPKGPNGERRPADVIGNAVRVMRIATGEVEEDVPPAPVKDEAAAMRRKGMEEVVALLDARMAPVAKPPTRRERDAAAFQKFVQQYGRKAQKGAEPNDRRFDKDLQVRARRMRPEDLDALLRDGEDENSN